MGSDDAKMGQDAASSGKEPERMIGSGDSARFVPANNTEKTIGAAEEGAEAKGTRPVFEKPAGSFSKAGSTKDADISVMLRESTREGGLREVPEDFEQRNGSWVTLLSDNPFEVLYLDYHQYESITPELVSQNHAILTAFWKKKQLAMYHGARESIEKRYGSDTVNMAEKKLNAAYDRLKSKERIALYHKEVDKRRLDQGFASLEELLNMSFASGEFTERQAGIIIQKGVNNGLETHEVVRHIHQELSHLGFKPRASKMDPNHPFRNNWMTDDAWAQRQRREVEDVEWMGERVSSLEEMGTITFRKKEEAAYFLKNTNFLPPLVARLTASASKAVEFEKIFEEERDMESRYLSVVYRLNPALPFRFQDETYSDIKRLLTAASQGEASFRQMRNLFENGHLHIWLGASDAEVAQLLPLKGEPNGFLRFLYRIDSGLPFFVKGEKFFTPAGLAAHLLKDRSLWIPLSREIENGNLFTWFGGIGKTTWAHQYNESYKRIIESGLYKGDILRMAAVQAVLQIIDPTISTPEVKSDKASVSLSDVEAGSIIKSSIRFVLKGDGLLKANVTVDKRFEGIEVKEKELLFDSAGAREHEIDFAVDGSKLSKDKLYNFNIQVTTVDNTLLVPVEIKVVFPVKAFVGKLLFYGVIGAVVFGLVRFILSLLIDYDGWLVLPEGRSFSLSGVDWLPGYRLLYFAWLVLSGYAVYRIVKWVRKKEGI